MFKDAYLDDKTTKAHEEVIFINVRLLMGEGHKGFLVASKALFLDLVVVMRLFPWNNSSSHIFVLGSFLYLC